MYDLISIGDTIVDTFLQVDLGDTESICKLDDEKCFVCFGYGSKIPVSKMTRIVGAGNAANNAIGSSRLGLKTAIYTVLGSDQDSQASKNVLENEDVSTDFVVTDPGKSNYSTVIDYGKERTIFAYHEPRKYNLPELSPTKWIYYTSLNKGYESIHPQIIEYIKKYDVNLAFNPGSYQLKDGLENLKPILAVCDLLILNKEEAQVLVGGEDIRELIAKLRGTGARTVIITDGSQGSYGSFDGREFWWVGVPSNVTVVEKTGAGDAYSTGFLAATIYGKPIAECMVWGTLNAASVVGFVGSRDGLLTKSGLEEFSKKYGQLKPRLI